MPRIRQNAAIYAREDLLRDIREKQGRQDLMTQTALARASEIPYQVLRRRLRNPDDLTIEELRKLHGVIGIDPKALLLCIGFTSKEIKACFAGGKEES